MSEENIPEETQETTTQVEEQNPTEVSEDEKTPAAIPYSRFQEVIEDKNEFKSENERLRAENEELKTKEPEEEPENWQEAEKRTVEKATAKMKAELQVEADKKADDDKVIEKGFDQLKRIGKDITPEVKKAVLEKMIESGEGVMETYLNIKDKIDKDTKATQLKEEGKIPSSQKGSEETPSFNYKEIRNKSLDDIMDEAA